MKTDKYTMDGIGKPEDTKKDHEDSVVEEKITTPEIKEDKIVKEPPIVPKKSPKPTLMKVNGTSKLRVRSFPDKDEDNVIGTLDRGDLVKVVGPAKDNPEFSEILFNNGKTAFVISTFLEKA